MLLSFEMKCDNPKFIFTQKLTLFRFVKSEVKQNITNALPTNVCELIKLTRIITSGGSLEDIPLRFCKKKLRPECTDRDFLNKNMLQI